MNRPRFVKTKRLLVSFRAAWIAFKAPIYPNFVVIYDVGNSGEEMYCGYGSDPAEAIEWFDTLYKDDPEIHNAYLCMMIKQVRPYGWDEVQL